MAARPSRSRDGIEPRLLLVFFAAAAVMVAAIIAMTQVKSDWGDAAAVGVIVVTAGLVLREIMREIGDDD